MTHQKAHFPAPMDACSSSPCNNGGTCIDVNVDTFIFTCRDDDYGNTCQHSKEYRHTHANIYKNKILTGGMDILITQVPFSMGNGPRCQAISSHLMTNSKISIGKMAPWVFSPTKSSIIYCWVYGQRLNILLASSCLLISSQIWATGQYACGSRRNIKPFGQMPSNKLYCFRLK